MILDKTMYKRREAADILSVSVDKIDRLCLEGELTRININANNNRPTYRITAESIQEFVDRLSKQNEA